MILGFTGTRRGLTLHQREYLARVLRDAEQITEAHHGCCVGADATFHELCIVNGIPVVLHPPTDPKWRAFCDGAALELAPLPYLVRNRAIVDAADALLAMPWEAVEPTSKRGRGTWATVRYARSQQHRTTLILKPGGGT
jgi:hypothetical protein